MADKMIHEMISAFAAGCMDKDNYTHFKDYLKAGGELPKGELGELQNIISMIPVILDLENPDPAIKDMVAKKLIGMKEEIKTKIIEGKKKTSLYERVENTPSAPPSPNTLTFKTKKNSKTTSAFQFSPDEPSSTFATQKLSEPILQEKIKTSASKQKTPLEDPRRLESIPPPVSLVKMPTGDDTKPAQPEKTSSGAAGWIALLLTIILFSILGYFTYSSIDSMNKEIKDLKDDIVSLKSELGIANNFITNYTSLIEFFNYEDISVVNLTSADPSENSSARVMLSFNEKEGLIQFKNAKQLPPAQAFQVWAVNKGQTYSLGTYRPTGSEYMKIVSFPFLPKEQIESFRITIESKEGAVSPSAVNYLTGIFSGGVVRRGVN
ncbi:hypothetical protein C0389_06290 [bacterium]|nr:hypothetical protein [bacterium]